MWLIFDQSPAVGSIPINTQQQTASFPFKPSQGHCLQVKMALLSVTEDFISDSAGKKGL